jgi:hypothetical protein
MPDLRITPVFRQKWIRPWGERGMFDLWLGVFMVLDWQRSSVILGTCSLLFYRQKRRTTRAGRPRSIIAPSREKTGSAGVSPASFLFFSGGTIASMVGTRND